MMNNFPNEVSYKVWNLIEFNGKNQIRDTVLLFRLLINTDPNNIHEQISEQDNTKDLNLEF